MNQPDLKSQFDSDGFVIIREFLSSNDFQSLNAELERYIREIAPTLPDSSAFYQDPARPETLKQLQNMGHDAYFNEMRSNELWFGLATTLLGEPCEAQEPEWFNKPPGTIHPTPPHQDNFYFCLKPPQVVTLWLALDKVDEENGCLRYVRGSHTPGVRNHAPTSILGFSQGIADFGEEDRKQEVPVLLEAGDLVAHHGNLIHRAEPNRTQDRHRRAFAMVYRGVSCQRDEAAFERYQAALQQQHAKMGLATK